MRVRGVAERVAAGYGLEIFDVQLRREGRGWILRIIIDRPAPAPRDDLSTAPAPEESVSIEDCRRVSEDMSAILDVEDTIEHAYTLEVSSPGLDRPLRHAGDYQRFRGRLAKIVTVRPLSGSPVDERRGAAEDAARSPREPAGRAGASGGVTPRALNEAGAAGVGPRRNKLREAQTHFVGRILGVEDDCVLLEEGRRVHRVPLAEISRARLDVEFAKK
jgi:ribosome maturation factor RimP